MKLEEMCTHDVLLEKDGFVLYAENLSESSVKMGFAPTRGGFIQKSLQGSTKFAKNNPFIVGAMAAYSVDAIKQYNKNKRKTITFYTKDMQEKKMFKEIVDTLMKTGKYRKEKETVVDGGYLFVLKRLG